MTSNVAIFLDLDNLVIGASEAKISFDISLILAHIKEMTNGRIIIRRAYGDWRQHQNLPRQLAQNGFELQSVVRLNNSDKNLADMQMAADALETLIDGRNLQQFVLVTGDRDFMPLVQVLRRHEKEVIGLGVHHTTSNSLVELCDHYIFYDDLVHEKMSVHEAIIEDWLQSAARETFSNGTQQVRASVFRENLQAVSGGKFGQILEGQSGFGRFLEKYPEIIHLQREDTTLFVCSTTFAKQEAPKKLSTRYRTELKRRGLRVVPAQTRLVVLRDIVAYLKRYDRPRWHQLVDYLTDSYAESEEPISKSAINDVLRVAKRANVIKLPPQTNAALAMLPIQLGINGNRTFQDSVVLTDLTYLRELEALTEFPFDVEQAALCLYDSAEKASYLEFVLKNARR